jgi:hypothetical protein
MALGLVILETGAKMLSDNELTGAALLTEEYTKVQIQRQENLTCATQNRLASAGEKRNAAVPVALAECRRGKDGADGAGIHESQLATKLVQ